MQNPLDIKLFYLADSGPFSVNELRAMVLGPDEIATCSDGEAYLVKHIIEGRAPRWNVSVENDPAFGPAYADLAGGADDIDYSGFESGFFEEMPVALVG